MLVIPIFFPINPDILVKFIKLIVFFRLFRHFALLFNKLKFNQLNFKNQFF